MSPSNRETRAIAEIYPNRWRQCFAATLLVAMFGNTADAAILSRDGGAVNTNFGNSLNRDPNQTPGASNIASFDGLELNPTARAVQVAFAEDQFVSDFIVTTTAWAVILDPFPIKPDVTMDLNRHVLDIAEGLTVGGKTLKGQIRITGGKVPI